jgi:response regulator RpfG family c-di-GMP phosphodiesterase
MLVDDSPDDNFFHEREIKKNDPGIVVLKKDSGTEALKCLKTQEHPHSDLIFLDINMPGMNGWEFLEEYKKLDKTLQSKAVIIMLTTSDNSDDIAKAKKYAVVSDYITKPLTKEMMEVISAKYFKTEIIAKK